MQKIRKFNTMFERNDAADDKNDMKRHTRAIVMKIVKRGRKHGPETSNEYSKV
jgi:hypothetical protein